MKGLLKRYNGNEAYEQGKANDNIDHRAVVYVKGETDKNRKLKMRYKHNYMENYGLLEMLSKTFYPSSRSDKSYCFVEGE